MMLIESPMYTTTWKCCSCICAVN